MQQPETRDIPTGATVWTVDKGTVGTVVGCWQARPALGAGQPRDVGFLRVDRGAAAADRWTFVPLDAIHYIHPDGVYLEIRAEDVEHQGWAVRK